MCDVCVCCDTMVQQEFEQLGSTTELREVTKVLTRDKKNIKRTGLLTGLAIALHNFPEGMATFVATLSSPSLGGALALAIALHNIPEGVCVAVPVYIATGSRVKAFLWALLSGVSEPIGMYNETPLNGHPSIVNTSI